MKRNIENVNKLKMLLIENITNEQFSSGSFYDGDIEDYVYDRLPDPNNAEHSCDTICWATYLAHEDNPDNVVRDTSLFLRRVTIDRSTTAREWLGLTHNTFSKFKYIRDINDKSISKLSYWNVNKLQVIFALDMIIQGHLDWGIVAKNVKMQDVNFRDTLYRDGDDYNETEQIQVIYNLTKNNEMYQK